MGEVFRVQDPELHRKVVMKAVRTSLSSEQQRRREQRFLTEARITAQLQHPGVVPVHEVGRLPDGRLYYIMREVHGKTLKQVISEVHWGIGSTWNLRRAVDVLRRVCETVAFAHTKRVIHRDLKPSNIMVGDFDEVQVLDWGLAKRLDLPDELGQLSETGLAAGEGAQTHHGAVLGTPVYMPPEQARGELERVDARSDVYALGATLYELLCGEPPYRGAPRVVLAAVRRGPPRDVVEVGRDDGIEVPEELAEICRGAMAREGARRTPSAKALASQLSDWLDGVRRRERARELAAEAGELWPEVQADQARAQELFQRAAAHLDQLDPRADVAERKVAWALEDEAKALARSASLTAIEVEQRLRTALTFTPEADEIHQRLADLYQGHMAAAEDRREWDQAARYEVLLKAHDRGRHRDWLQGDGAVTLVTDPAGARVSWFRIVEVERRMEPVFEGILGTTPLVEQRLPRGSHLLVIEAEGRAPVRYPVSIGRREHWDGVRPGSTEPTVIRLPRAEEIGPEDCIVPAGWFWSGGDKKAIDPAPGRRLWVDGFVVRRFPVTMGEYAAFLGALREQGRFDDRLLPRENDHLGAEFPRLRWDGQRFLPEAGSKNRWLGLRHPAVFIDHASAEAWCRWLGQQDGRRWRLPHDQEWEKAARGVDRRSYPWGDHSDPAWACQAMSHGGEVYVVPVDDFPLDVSIYGVRGCGGNVTDWCANSYLKVPTTPEQVDPLCRGSGDKLINRGGLFFGSSPAGRCSTRFALEPSGRRSGVGFRAVRSV
jgi:serine/threonine-protein kinase